MQYLIIAACAILALAALTLLTVVVGGLFMGIVLAVRNLIATWIEAHRVESAGRTDAPPEEKLR
jgi:hypothetical protein